MNFFKSSLFTGLLIFLTYCFRKIVSYYSLSESLQIVLITAIFICLLLVCYNFKFPKIQERIIKGSFDKKIFICAFLGVVGIQIFYVNLQIIAFKSIPDLQKVPSAIKVFTPLNTVLLLFILPFMEELFFRDFLLRQLHAKYSFYKAIVVSSILFAVAHFHSDSGILAQFIAGLFFGYIYLKTKKNWLPIFVLHLSFNALTILYINLGLIQKYLNLLDIPSLTGLIVVGASMIITSIFLIRKNTRQLIV